MTSYEVRTAWNGTPFVAIVCGGIAKWYRDCDSLAEAEALVEAFNKTFGIK